MGGLVRMLIVVAFFVILASLGSALYHLYRGEERDSQQMLRALTVRIALSLALFALIMIAWWAGLITPEGLQAHSPPSPAAACTGAGCPPGAGGG